MSDLEKVLEILAQPRKVLPHFLFFECKTFLDLIRAASHGGGPIYYRNPLYYTLGGGGGVLFVLYFKDDIEPKHSFIRYNGYNEEWGVSNTTESDGPNFYLAIVNVKEFPWSIEATRDPDE